jgi:uncharacterized protein
MRPRFFLSVPVIATAALGATGLAAATAPLIDAVKSGNRAAVQELLRQKADVNLPEPDQTTALHWAVRGGDVQTALLLIRAGAKVNAANRFGVTPMRLAAGNGDARLVEALLAAGVDPNETSPEGETILMTASRSGGAEAVQVLLAHGASVNRKEGWHEQTALMWAAGDNQPAIVKALLAAGAEINGRSKVLPGAPVGRGRGSETSFQSAHSTFPRGGFTPMLFAAREGSLDAARVLVEGGADVNLADPDGISPAMMSIINGHYDTAALLIRAKGVSVDAVDKAGRTALFFAADMHRLEWLFSRPTPRPSGELDSLDVVKLLLAAGANPDMRLTGRPFTIHHDSGGHPSLVEGATPFMKAASTSDVALMKILLEHGADPGIATKDGTTPMMLAAGLEWREIASLGTEQESLEAITLLLERGADVNAANAAGETALHGAAQRGADKIVQWLVDHGARLDAKNAAGRMPIDEAMGQASGAGDAVRRPERPTTQALLRALMSRTPPGARRIN